MATANGFLTSDDELLLSEIATEPAAYEFQSDLSDDDEAAPGPLALGEIATASLALTSAPPESPAKNRVEAWLAASGRENGVAREEEGKKGPSAGGVRPVEIEVVLPWLSPEKRGEYQFVEVDEFADHEYHRPRRKRCGVSQIFCVLRVLRLCLLSVFLEPASGRWQQRRALKFRRE